MEHEQMFYSICGRMKPKDESLEGFMLKCFEFSLTDYALSWYDSSCVDYKGNYWDLRAQFLKEFSPPSFRFEVRHKLRTFTQFPGETLYEYNVRFNTLQGSCPHHGFADLFLIQRFLEGMMPLERNMLDDAAGDSVMNVGMDDLWDLIDDVAERSRPRQGQTKPLEDDVMELAASTQQLANTVHENQARSEEEPRSDYTGPTEDEDPQMTEEEPAKTGPVLITELSETDPVLVVEVPQLDPSVSMHITATKDDVINDEVQGKLEAEQGQEKPTMERSLTTS